MATQTPSLLGLWYDASRQARRRAATWVFCYANSHPHGWLLLVSTPTARSCAYAIDLGGKSQRLWRQVLYDFRAGFAAISANFGRLRQIGSFRQFSAHYGRSFQRAGAGYYLPDDSSRRGSHPYEQPRPS